ncbi:hypothetical protein ABZ490_14555 [Streptomyces sp. NPDC005811]
MIDAKWLRELGLTAGTDEAGAGMESAHAAGWGAAVVAVHPDRGIERMP